jgi:plasmid stabilization system protein ParE
MTYKVLLTRRAEVELNDAADWWAEHRSIKQATRWYSKFSDAIAALAENPRRCPLAAENGRFRYEIRELCFGLGSRPTHRAVFTIEADTVVVLAIRHVAQSKLTEHDLP